MSQKDEGKTKQNKTKGGGLKKIHEKVFQTKLLNL